MKMNGFKLFPIHIAIKDLSFMIIYFIIMKYNLTNESELTQVLKNSPNISNWSLWSIIESSIFYNLTTLILSSITYFPIVYLFKKLISENHKLRLIITGIILTTTTPIYYLTLKNWKHNDYYLPNAELIAWILCFALSIGIYYLLNIRNTKLTELENENIN